MTAGEPSSAANGLPVLRVVRGRPTEEELAAVLVVLAGRSNPRGDPGRQDRPSGWSAYWRAIRAPLVPGPGGWRSSARPQ